MDPYGAQAASVSADVIIIGDGVVGLSTAFELARLGATFILVGAYQAGAASSAAAGLLAPSVGYLPDAVHPFFFDSLSRYPAFVESLRAFEPALAILNGLIDLSRTNGSAAHSGRPLTASSLTTLEPSLRLVGGGRFHPHDGAIDNVLLVKALRRAVEGAPGGRIVSGDPAAAIKLGDPQPSVLLRSGSRVRAHTIVLAAGAWSAGIAGLPRPLPVVPLKGQMFALASTCLAHAVIGDDVYLVPRGSEIAIGATTEHAGFDVTTTPEAIDRLRRAAIDICPAITPSPVTRTWAGTRPATPDMLPIIGNDPNEPRLIYACGHSKNGILLAPATAAAVAALAQRRSPTSDLTPFSVGRFS